MQDQLNSLNQNAPLLMELLKQYRSILDDTEKYFINARQKIDCIATIPEPGNAPSPIEHPSPMDFATELGQLIIKHRRLNDSFSTVVDHLNKLL